MPAPPPDAPQFEASPTWPDPSARRDPSFYRGRHNPTRPGEVLAWFPRVVLSPLYLLAEFGVRRPVYGVAEWADRNHVIDILDRTFNPLPNVRWFPTVWIDLGVAASVGIKGYWRDLLVRGHEFGASAATGGVNFWHLAAHDRWQFGLARVGVRGDYLTRPDRPFYGLGPYSGPTETRFSQTRSEAFATAGIEYGNYVFAELSGGYRAEHFGPGESPSIETVFQTQNIPGYSPSNLLMAMLDLRLDTRTRREDGQGALLVANVSYGHDAYVEQRSFVSAEVDFQGAIEVMHPGRVLTARLYGMDTFPLGTEPVPFGELAMLGWDHHYGFIWGRFRGESALMAELRYHYPIAYYVDAQWVTSVGNVFNRTFSDFTPGALTGSLGLGLRTRNVADVTLEAMVAVGTSRFDEPFAIDSVRVYVGTTGGP